MRSPSIAPDFNSDVYLVLDDFGPLGRSYRETEEERADRQSVIRDLMGGQFNNPARIVAFNTAEGWSRDVTAEIAKEIWDSGEELSPGLRDFIENEFAREKRMSRT